MAKDKKVTQVNDIKGEEQKADAPVEIKVNEGNVGFLTVKILVAILDQLKKMNAMLEESK